MTFRERLLRHDLLVGCFVNTGSAIAAEICARAGFQWVLIDLEHGSATEADLLPQLQAIASTAATPLVRVESNERPRFTKALDFGAEVLMVPQVQGAEDATMAVRNMRYHPAGVRGVALMNRAATFGIRRDIVETSDARVSCVIQIETKQALAEADDIASIDGVDCLFVGPADLSHALGVFLQSEDATFLASVEAVRTAAAAHGKAAGVLARDVADAKRYRELGYSLIGIGSDTSFLADGARAAASAFT